MIRLRRTIERGVRHRWLGPLFVLLLVLLLVLTALHAVHDGDHATTGVGDLCLGLAVMVGLVLTLRIGRPATITVVARALGRAPPARPAQSLLRGCTAGPTPVPLRL